MQVNAELANVSVVIPTLNCVHLIEPVIETLRRTLASVGEVVVVDSNSTDGTPELLRDRLDCSNIKILSHPRGLYASWNHGIANTSREWIYIATAGDAINVEDLAYLHNVGVGGGVDVVCAPPRFVNEGGDPIPDLTWPILDLLREREGEDLVFLSKDALLAFSLIHGRPRKGYCGWLGSSASNLYRSEILKTMPFPTDVGRTGDTYWGIWNAPSLRAVFCRRRCGRFVVHERDLASEEIGGEELMLRYNEISGARIRGLFTGSGDSDCDPQLRALVLDLFENERQLSERVAKLVKAREFLRVSLHGCRVELERSRELVERLNRRRGLLPGPLRDAVGRATNWATGKRPRHED